jgi:hypothetical protein
MRVKPLLRVLERRDDMGTPEIRERDCEYTADKFLFNSQFMNVESNNGKPARFVNRTTYRNIIEKLVID